MPQAAGALLTPINELERDFDADGVWRRYVNQQLAGPYQTLFGLIDSLLLLRAQRFEDVYAWRLLQERKLAAKRTADPVAAGASRLMGEQELRRFIMHFERLTRHILVEMPARAQIVAELDGQRQVVAVHRADGTAF